MDYNALKRPQRGFDPDKLQSIDIPQASLPKIRELLIAIRAGAQTQAAIIEATDFSRRHVQYRLQAARVLRLVNIDGVTIRLCPIATELLAAEPVSVRAAAIWTSVIAASPVLQRLAPELLSDDGPTQAELFTRIMLLSQLGEATARRRARDLISWRLHVRSAL
jgi:hypothetical protein